MRELTESHVALSPYGRDWARRAAAAAEAGSMLGTRLSLFLCLSVCPLSIAYSVSHYAPLVSGLLFVTFFTHASPLVLRDASKHKIGTINHSVLQRNSVSRERGREDEEERHPVTNRVDASRLRLSRLMDAVVWRAECARSSSFVRLKNGP